MENTYKIAIVGQKDVVMAFKAIGITSVNAVTSEQALEAITKLKNEKAAGSEKPLYAIIIVTEELASGFPEEEMKKLTSGMLPAILVIPGVKGSTGFGMRRLGKIVEKAIGSNILKDQ